VRPTTKRQNDQDAHIRAIEGDRATDEQQGNENAQVLDDQGMPADCDKVAEDVIGANLDDTQG